MDLQPDQDLQAQAQRWRLHMDQTPLAVIEWDMEGRVRSWNPAAERMFGYAAQEAIGQPIIELIVPPKVEVLDQVHDIADSLTREGRKSRVEHENRRKDGSIILCRWFNTPLTDESGRPLGVASMALDVTEVQRANQALLESEQRFRTVADFTHDWEYWTAPDGGILWMSPSCERITGYSAEAFRQDPGLIIRICHPDDRAAVMDHAHESTERQGIAPLEFRIQHGDGREVWISHICFPVQDRQGNPAGRRVSNRDITERKRSELGLQESEQRFRTIFEKAIDGIIIFSLEGRLLDLNDAFARMHGRTRAEMRGLPVTALNTPMTNAMVPERLRRMMAGQTLKVELEQVHKDGHTFLTEATASLVYYAGQPAILSFHRDITERKRIEEALLQSEQQLRHFVEHTPAAIALLDADMNYLVVSRRWLEDYRLREQSIVGRNHYEVFPDLPQRWIDIHRRCLAGAVEKCDEDPFLRADGTTDWVRWEIRPWNRPNGSIGGLIIFTEVITDRKQAEATLLRSQAMLARTEGLAHIGSWEWDVATDTVTWSDEMFRILQRDPAEGAVAYADHAEIYPPEDLARLRKHVEAALDRGEPYELELHAIRPSGEVRICLDRGFPEMGADGKVNRLFGTLQDITQRKQAEASLLASEERLRLALEATSDGLWDWNVTTGEVYYSPTYTRMLGYELREFAAQISSWADLIFPEDRARVLAINEACIQGLHDHFEVEFRMKARDGATRWIRGRGKAISRDPQGRALRILGTHQDVTEKRVAEELLRASEERFRHISSSMLDVAFSCLQQPGEAFAIDWMIGATESLFGRPIDEIKAARCWGNFVVEEDLPIFLKQVLGLAAGETGTCELRLRKKDGGLTWVQSYAQCLASPETPSSHRLLGALVDITERKQAAEENARLQAQLQQAQKMESLGTLAGGIAHDMNNVLGAILGLASANLEVQPAGTPAHRSFETIVKAATRGGEMVRSLLSFARQGRVETCELDLNAILREEVRLLERTTLSNVRLELDLEPGLRPMRGDAGALTHALMNLCVNAVDAMPDQGTLTLRTRNVDSAWIEVVVEDTGTGMSKEVREKAMEPFFTTKGVGKGTGLGLSMVYTTVQAHKGDMEILSEPGRGTSVRLRFPACEPETRVGSPGSDLPTEPPSGALKVLLVDDDELIQSSIQALLEALGHAAFMVPSGEAALTAVEEGFRPDVVILDMNMPGLGGKGTLPRLRTLLPQVPVLLSTGRADQAALELAEAHPHVTLMPKPFALKELQARLEPFRRGR